ncbi:restriction endonuclease [Bartonella japonica]|uniref:Restriction endonuclease n=1 Tax=Bartonella japonica TaxID=357761 RepID=A0ABV2FP34_9HYPH
MKLKFRQQEFQNDAVKSVIDLFKGQPRRDSSICVK